VGDGLGVRPGLRHAGLARQLVHDLKYRAVAPVAEILAVHMIVPPTAAVLVPVPRVALRRVRLGVDPAEELARALARRCALPVVFALRSPLWQPGNAGKGRTGRHPVVFRRTRTVDRALLVDDVVTTGATLQAAAMALGRGVLGAVTATGACV
jgi:predicted amidophosphoribosyltransferase